MNMASRAWRRNPAAGRPPAFPPGVVVAVKALVCELPHRCGLPLSRWSLADLEREVVGQGIVEVNQWFHPVALAQPRSALPVAIPKLDLSARSQLRRQGRPGA
jgi:hypothetical protein